MELSLNNHEPRNSECGCRTCDRVFASERAFDAHRIGEPSEVRKCAENLSGVGLEMDLRGRWRQAKSSIEINARSACERSSTVKVEDLNADRKERLRDAIRKYTENEQKKRNKDGASGSTVKGKAFHARRPSA